MSQYVIMDACSRYWGRARVKDGASPAWVTQQHRALAYSKRQAMAAILDLAEQDGSDLPLRIERIIDVDDTEPVLMCDNCEDEIAKDERAYVSTDDRRPIAYHIRPCAHMKERNEHVPTKLQDKR